MCGDLNNSFSFFGVGAPDRTSHSSCKSTLNVLSRLQNLLKSSSVFSSVLVLINTPFEMIIKNHTLYYNVNTYYRNIVCTRSPIHTHKCLKKVLHRTHSHSTHTKYQNGGTFNHETHILFPHSKIR